MRRYEAPELVKYALLDGVGQAVCSPSNTADSCSCDCCFDSSCVNVRSGVFGPCTDGGKFGTCTTEGGDPCG